MVTIQQYIDELVDSGEGNRDIGERLGVSYAMVSKYKKDYYPSLAVAKKVYTMENIVLHPYSEESLKFEIKVDNDRAITQ